MRENKKRLEELISKITKQVREARRLTQAEHNAPEEVDPFDDFWWAADKEPK